MVVVGLVVASAVAFAVFRPIKVLPRIRPAPGFALVDQHGTRLTSDDLRGSVTLYAFTYGRCPPPCQDIDRVMQDVALRLGPDAGLGGVRFRLVTVSFDPERDTPAALAAAADRSGADGDRWRWATVADATLLKEVVGGGFRVFYERSGDDTFRFDRTFVLVDGAGVIRGDYRYSTLTDDADRIVRQVGVLGSELRNAKGVGALAYKAAHLFLCYS